MQPLSGWMHTTKRGEATITSLQGELEAAQRELAEAIVVHRDEYRIWRQTMDSAVEAERTRREEAERAKDLWAKEANETARISATNYNRAIEAERRLSEYRLALLTQWHRAHNNCPDEGRKEDCESAGCQAARAVLAEKDEMSLHPNSQKEILSMMPDVEAKLALFERMREIAEVLIHDPSAMSHWAAIQFRRVLAEADALTEKEEK